MNLKGLQSECLSLQAELIDISTSSTKIIIKFTFSNLNFFFEKHG